MPESLRFCIWDSWYVLIFSVCANIPLCQSLWHGMAEDQVKHPIAIKRQYSWQCHAFVICSDRLVKNGRTRERGREVRSDPRSDWNPGPMHTSIWMWYRHYCHICDWQLLHTFVYTHSSVWCVCVCHTCVPLFPGSAPTRWHHHDSGIFRWSWPGQESGKEPLFLPLHHIRHQHTVAVLWYDCLYEFNNMSRTRMMSSMMSWWWAKTKVCFVNLTRWIRFYRLSYYYKFTAILFSFFFYIFRGQNKNFYCHTCIMRYLSENVLMGWTLPSF